MESFYLGEFLVTRETIFSHSPQVPPSMLYGSCTKTAQPHPLPERDLLYLLQGVEKLPWTLVISKPMTDLCAVWQKNSVAILRSVNLSEDEETEVAT